MAVTDSGKRAGVSPTQRKRSVAIALGLGVMAVLFFAVTIVQMKGNVAKRMQQEGKASRSIILPEGQDSVSGQ